MSLLSRLKSNTYLPQNTPQMLPMAQNTQPPSQAAEPQHGAMDTGDSNQMAFQQPSTTPIIPPHPTIAFTPKTPHILNAAPRKKRITYKSQDEKKEALRERSRDNRRRAKEKKDYMDHRITWLEYENGCIREMLQRKMMCIEEMKRQLAQGVAVKGVVVRLNWQDIPFFARGGAEAIFASMNMEKIMFGEPELQGTSDNASVSSSATIPQKRASSERNKKGSKKSAAKKNAKNPKARSAKSVASTSSTNSLSSFDEEEFEMDEDDDNQHNTEEFRAGAASGGAAKGSSNAHGSDTPPLRLTRAQKRKRAEEAQNSWSGDEAMNAPDLRNPRKMRVTESMLHAAEALTHHQHMLHAQPDQLHKHQQQQQLEAFRQHQQYLHSQQQLQQDSAAYVNLLDTLKQAKSAPLEHNTNPNRLFIL